MPFNTSSEWQPKQKKGGQVKRIVMIFQITLFDVCHQAPKKMKKKTVEGGSNVFSMFEQSQIQEFKEVRWDKFLLHGPKPNILRMWIFSSVCLKYCGKYFCFHPQSLNHQFELDVFNFFSFVMATALLSLSSGLHYHGPEQRRLHW